MADEASEQNTKISGFKSNNENRFVDVGIGFRKKPERIMYLVP